MKTETIVLNGIVLINPGTEVIVFTKDGFTKDKVRTISIDQDGYGYFLEKNSYLNEHQVFVNENDIEFAVRKGISKVKPLVDKEEDKD